MNAREAATQYMNGINAADAEMVSSVFADDAWLRPPPPVGGAIHGRSDIHAFYQKLFATLTKLHTEVDYIAEGNRCVVLMRTTHNGGVGEVIDVFTMDASGKVAEMVAYRRSPWSSPDTLGPLIQTSS